MLFHSGCGYYRGNVRISWKYTRTMNFIRISWKYTCFVDIIHISCIYPYFVGFIRISYKYTRSVDIVRNQSVLSLTFYPFSESEWCRLSHKQKPNLKSAGIGTRNHSITSIASFPYHLRFNYSTSVVENFSTQTYIYYKQLRINSAILTTHPIWYTNYSSNILQYEE